MRDRLMGLARDDDEKIFIAQCIDIIERVGQRDYTELTNMLHPGQVELLTQVASYIGDVRIKSWGAFEAAERKRCAVLPLWCEWFDELDFDLVVFSVVTDSPIKLSHRDYLGALLGLGIKRETIGDIIVTDEKAFIVCVAEIAPFIRSSLHQVGSAKVTLEQVSQAAINDEYLPRYQQWTTTVASSRLDAIIARGFNLSRDKARTYVTQGRVKLNHRLQTSPAASVEAGDLISCRGQGRVRLFEVLGESRKGRVRIVLGKPNGQ